MAHHLVTDVSVLFSWLRLDVTSGISFFSSSSVASSSVLETSDAILSTSSSNFLLRVFFSVSFFNVPVKEKIYRHLAISMRILFRQEVLRDQSLNMIKEATIA